MATLPSPQLLDDLAAFQQVLFTNPQVRAVADAVAAGTVPPDPDPPLTELEEQGKAVFTRACAQCHGGPGQSTSQAPLTAVALLVFSGSGDHVSLEGEAGTTTQRANDAVVAEIKSLENARLAAGLRKDVEAVSAMTQKIIYRSTAMAES